MRWYYVQYGVQRIEMRYDENDGNDDDANDANDANDADDHRCGTLVFLYRRSQLEMYLCETVPPPTPNSGALSLLSPHER